MSIRLGVYDFFSYVLPGAAFLTGGVFISTYFFELFFHDVWGAIGLTELLLAGACSYVIGFMISPISYWSPWFKLFGPKHPEKVAFDQVKKTYPNLDIKFEASYWPLLQATIALQSEYLASQAEKHRATSIMLRNFSLVFFLFAIASSGLFIFTGSQTGVWGAFVFVASSVLTATGAHTFARWSYKVVFESTLAIQDCSKQICS